MITPNLGVVLTSGGSQAHLSYCSLHIGPPLLATSLLLRCSELRPDPIDEFAPDSRRELAKGVSVEVLSCANKGLCVELSLFFI